MIEDGVEAYTRKCHDADRRTAAKQHATAAGAIWTVNTYTRSEGGNGSILPTVKREPRKILFRYINL